MTVSLLNPNNSLTAPQMEALRSTICKGLSPEEISLFGYVCQRTGLDPFIKQIYPVKRFNKKLGRDTMTIQTGIDGYRLISDRTGKYVPGREPTFTYDSNGKLFSATAYVKKLASDGSWHEVPGVAFYAEYVQEFNGKPTSFWLDMPHNQLAKCAEALAHRKAFPGRFDQVYTAEEMQQSETCVVVAPSVASEDESDELEQILAQCDKDFQGRLLERVKGMGKQNVRALPVDLYQRTLKAAMDNIQKNAQKRQLQVEAARDGGSPEEYIQKVV